MNSYSSCRRAVEHLTFGRPLGLLVRVWLLEVVVVFTDVQVFNVVHPALASLFETRALRMAYAIFTLVSLVMLLVFLRRMGKLTFDPGFHRFQTVAISALGYVVLGGTVVIMVSPIPSLTPGLFDGATPTELLASANVAVVLAVFQAVGFYAQFDDQSTATRTEIVTALREWLAARDWADEPDRSLAKEDRYEDFRARTERVADVLEGATTTRGIALREEFEEWQSEFFSHDVLTQEAVLTGDVETDALQREHEKVAQLAATFETLAE